MDIYDFTGLHDLKHTFCDKMLDDIEDIFICHNELYELLIGYCYENKFIEVYKQKNKQNPKSFVSLEFSRVDDGKFIFQNAVNLDMREVYPPSSNW